MTRIVLFLVGMLLTFEASGQSFAQASTARSLKIHYEKKAEGNAGRMHSEGIVRGTPEEVWKAIVRINDWSTFMPRMPASFYVSREGIKAIQKATTDNPQALSRLAERYPVDVPKRPGGKWEGTVFQVIDMPFPVVNRWLLLKYRNDESDRSHHRYEQCWSMVGGNVNSVHGYFKVGPGPTAEETSLSYEEVSDLGGHVPEWAVKIGIYQTTPDVFKNLEKEIAKGQAFALH